jgi:hypothetical protein
MEQHPYVPHFDHIDPAADSEEESQYADSPAEDDVASMIFLQSLHMNFDKLEQSIQTYISTPAISRSANTGQTAYCGGLCRNFSY